MKPKPVSASALYGFAYPVTEKDLNPYGELSGGQAVVLIDDRAAKVVRTHRRGRWRTAAIDHIEFLRPVYEDEILLFFASINRVWNTSCEVGVKILAKNPKTGLEEHVVSAYCTFVALDKRGKPTPVAQVVPQTPEELRRFKEAELRRQQRLAKRKKSPHK